MNDVKNKFYALHITHTHMQSRYPKKINSQFGNEKKYRAKAHANLPKIGLFRFWEKKKSILQCSKWQRGVLKGHPFVELRCNITNSPRKRICLGQYRVPGHFLRFFIVFFFVAPMQSATWHPTDWRAPPPKTAGIEWSAFSRECDFFYAVPQIASRKYTRDNRRH